MAKLLITSATGTVGSELVTILKEQEADFKVLVRSKEKLSHLLREISIR